jgi:hypothetical protein
MLLILKRVTTGLFIFIFSHAVFSLDTSKRFAPSEHIALGEKVALTLADGTDSTNPLLHFPSGLALHYADIIALGDFYFVPGQPISFGESAAERKQRFLASFSTLANSYDAKIEANKISEIMHSELARVRAGIENGEKPEDIYSRIAEEFDIQYNCITGGGCSRETWLVSQGRYLKIAAENFDHFGEQAWLTYSAGHQAAINMALSARSEKNPAKLELAYAMDAFATHFATDRFSAGHMRTPRIQLPNQVTPAIVGSILINYMHNEESRYGLHVHNQLGEHWIAYGDSALFDNRNTLNETHLAQFIRTSVAQIKQAYFSGVAAPMSELADLIPTPDYIGSDASQDIAPLFYWDSARQRILRRASISNPYHYEWIKDWWGWSTLLELAKEHGLPLKEQFQLRQAGLQI